MFFFCLDFFVKFSLQITEHSGNIAASLGRNKETEFIKQLGFSGKSIIHPNQIKIIHDIFTPTEQEIAKAQKIIAAAKEAAARGQGAERQAEKKIK